MVVFLDHFYIFMGSCAVRDLCGGRKETRERLCNVLTFLTHTVDGEVSAWRLCSPCSCFVYPQDPHFAARLLKYSIGLKGFFLSSKKLICSTWFAGEVWSHYCNFPVRFVSA